MKEDTMSSQQLPLFHNNDFESKESLPDNKKPHLTVGTELENEDSDKKESHVIQQRTNTIHDILPTPIMACNNDQREVLSNIGNKINIPKRRMAGGTNFMHSSISISSNNNGGVITDFMSDQLNRKQEQDRVLGHQEGSVHDEHSEEYDSVSESFNSSWVKSEKSSSVPTFKTPSKRMVSILEPFSNTSSQHQQNSKLCHIVDHPTVMPHESAKLHQNKRIMSDIHMTDDSSSHPNTSLSGNRSVLMNSEIEIPKNAYPQKRIISLPIDSSETFGNKPSSVSFINGFVRHSKIYDQGKRQPEDTEESPEDVFETLDIIQGHDLSNGFSVENTGGLKTFTKIAKLGTGNFSEVFLYKKELLAASMADAIETSLVACKHIKYPAALTSLSSTSQAFTETVSKLESSLTRELYVLNKFKNRHRNIISLEGINDLEFLTNPRPLSTRIQNNTGEINEGHNASKLPECYIFTSYCKGGDLLKFAQQNKLSIQMIRAIFKQVADGVKFLHENLVIHRDLKLENILMNCSFDELQDVVARMDGSRTAHTDTCLIKIADFGLCKAIEPDELCTTRCGSEDYVAPEILMGLEYDGRSTDCWALGVILYALLEDVLPFDIPGTGVLSPNSVIQRKKKARPASYRIVRCDWKWWRMKNIEVSDDVTSSSNTWETETVIYQTQAKKIVEKCLIRRTHRWNIDDILGSDFLNGSIN